MVAVADRSRQSASPCDCCQFCYNSPSGLLHDYTIHWLLLPFFCPEERFIVSLVDVD